MNNENNLLKSPWLSPGACAAIILAFLLPFCNFKCGGVKIASVQGIDLVIGGKPELNSSLGGLADKEDMKGTGEKTKVNMWVIMALGAAVGGAGMHFAQFPQKQTVLLGLAALGLLALLVFAITKNGFFDVNKAGLNSNNGSRDFGMSRVVSIGLGIGYWISVAGFLLVGWLSWSGMRQPAAGAIKPGEASAPQG
jgi:hypothetical protein